MKRVGGHTSIYTRGAFCSLVIEVGGTMERRRPYSIFRAVDDIYFLSHTLIAYHSR